VRSWAGRRALGQYPVCGAPRVASPAAVPPWSEVGDPGKQRELGLVPPVASKGPGGQYPRCPSWGPSHMPAPRGNSEPSLGHVSGEMRVHPAGGAAAGRGIYSIMCHATISDSTMMGEAKSAPSGSLTGLITGDDAVPSAEGSLSHRSVFRLRGRLLSRYRRTATSSTVTSFIWV